MIRRSPCEVYLKYLIVRHERYSDEQIRQICQQQQLDYIGTHYIQQLRRNLATPLPFYPENRYHTNSFRFLLANGLASLYHPDAHMVSASRLLEYPRAKYLIENMLINESPFDWVQGALLKNGFSVSLEAIAQYKRHYFDVDLVDPTELRTLLRLRVQEGAASTDPEVARVAAAYEKAAWSDPRIASTNAPINSISTMINAMRVGFMPDPAGLPKILATGRMLGAARIVEKLMIGGPDSAADCSYVASTIKVLNEIMESVGSPDEDIQQRLSKLKVQTEEASVPMLTEISGGSHTAEMEPQDGERYAGAGKSRT